MSVQSEMSLLGKTVKDITGFEGYVESVAFDLYGCVQVAVQPVIGPTNTDKDGKKPDGRWFDSKRLTVTNQTPIMPVPTFADPIGGAERSNTVV